MIRVRIPPSPTGLLHIGTVRTALYNYLFAQHGDNDGPGTMVFRIEDTDKARNTAEFEKDIINGLVKLGIAGDEGVHAGGDFGPYRQSEKTEVYQKYLQQLLDEDKAYYCFCSKERLEKMKEEQRAAHAPPRYDGACSEIDPTEAKKRVESGEPYVIRLRVPNDKDLRFNDLVRGETVIMSKELDDFVIARKIDDPLYHLTVVADDHDMKITHVIRGEDHISNTPKQVLLFHALGWQEPQFAHLPLILNEDKSKLSKRKNKVSMDDFLNDGYLPEAILNFLALLGWNTPDEQEIFSMEELVEKFTLDRVHKGGAVFDVKKLDWVNGEYIKKEIAQDINKFMNRLQPFIENKLPTDQADLIKKIIQDPDFSGRFVKLSEIPGALSIFFTEVTDYPLDLIMREKFGITKDILKTVLEAAKASIEKTNWEKGDSSKNDELSEKMISLVSELGLKNGQVLWPLRVALSGLERSPNFSTLMVYLGKEESLKRIDFALQKL